MRRILSRLSVLAVCVVLMSGCALTTWSRMQGKEVKDTVRGFSATVPADWMRLNWADKFLVTKDGVDLNYIIVDRIRFKDKLESTKKQFLPDMAPQDLAEVEIDNIRSDEGFSNLNIVRNEPATIDGEPAFVFEYTVATGDGLPLRGIHYGFILNEKVYRIRFQAADQHYFAARKAEFEQFMGTFKLDRKPDPELPKPTL